MTVQEFRAGMLKCALKTAMLIADAVLDESIKLEPETVIAATAEIRAVMTDTEDFLEENFPINLGSED